MRCTDIAIVTAGSDCVVWATHLCVAIPFDGLIAAILSLLDLGSTSAGFWKVVSRYEAIWSLSDLARKMEVRQSPVSVGGPECTQNSPARCRGLKDGTPGTATARRTIFHRTRMVGVGTGIRLRADWLL